MEASEPEWSGHPLEGAWKKVRWAKVNLDALQREMSDFFGDASDPDSLRGYLDIEMPDKLPQTRLNPPWHWPLLVADVIQAFRVSLDYLAWELARLNLHRQGETRRPKRETAFPLVSDAKYWSFDSPKLVDIGADQRELIEKFQPYNDDPESQKTAKPPLDWLRDLSNQDKHTELALILGHAAMIDERLEHAKPGWALVSSSESSEATITDPEGNEKAKLKIKSAFFMALEDAGRIDWILDGIGPKVVQVISAFEPLFEDA
jgi:hypothetical protein